MRRCHYKYEDILTCIQPQAPASFTSRIHRHDQIVFSMSAPNAPDGTGRKKL